MSRRVLRITHTKGDRNDRASALLRERGFALETIRPIDGEILPEPKRADYAAVVVYGGPQSINQADELSYIADEIAWTRDFWEEMRQGTRGSVYLNFVGEGEDNEAMLRAAYGDANYERLVEVKTKFDPENFFRLNQNIRPRP